MAGLSDRGKTTSVVCSTGPAPDNCRVSSSRGSCTSDADSSLEKAKVCEHRQNVSDIVMHFVIKNTHLTLVWLEIDNADFLVDVVSRLS